MMQSWPPVLLQTTVLLDFSRLIFWSLITTINPDYLPRGIIRCIINYIVCEKSTRKFDCGFYLTRTSPITNMKLDASESTRENRNRRTKEIKMSFRDKCAELRVLYRSSIIWKTLNDNKTLLQTWNKIQNFKYCGYLWEKSLMRFISPLYTIAD